jgi:hypothetical protein
MLFEFEFSPPVHAHNVSTAAEPTCSLGGFALCRQTTDELESGVGQAAVPPPPPLALRAIDVEQIAQATSVPPLLAQVKYSPVGRFATLPGETASAAPDTEITPLVPKLELTIGEAPGPLPCALPYTVIEAVDVSPAMIEQLLKRPSSARTPLCPEAAVVLMIGVMIGALTF